MWRLFIMQRTHSWTKHAYQILIRAKKCLHNTNHQQSRHPGLGITAFHFTTLSIIHILALDVILPPYESRNKIALKYMEIYIQDFMEGILQNYEPMLLNSVLAYIIKNSSIIHPALSCHETFLYDKLSHMCTNFLQENYRILRCVHLSAHQIPKNDRILKAAYNLMWWCVYTKIILCSRNEMRTNFLNNGLISGTILWIYRIKQGINTNEWQNLRLTPVTITF